MTKAQLAPLRGRSGNVSLRDRRGPARSVASCRAPGTLAGVGMPIPMLALDPAALLELQRTAGNQAVTALLEGKTPSGWARTRVQRSIGWKTASKEGDAWNVDEHKVGKIRRIPLEGLAQGLQESAMIRQLSSESAKGRAIVLVPESLDPNKPIEVLVHLHGYTEDTSRPFAGWRALAPAAGKTKSQTLHALRQGVDDKDVAPVRDVALDQAEQQLEESGYAQQAMVLPQGGLKSQFGKAGDYDFDANAYVQEIVIRLATEGVWKKVPIVGRVSMAGHSGASTTLAKMARESVNRQAGQKAGASSTLSGDLVLFDAINSSDLPAFTDWALMRLDQDMAALKTKKTEAEKLRYLQTAQKLRGYYSTGEGGGMYKKKYKKLQGAIDGWFKTHAAELGPIAGSLYANFVVDNPVPVSHEELMRGVVAGKKRAGKGSILDALKALHPAASTAAHPLPASATPAAKPAGKQGADQSAPRTGHGRTRQPAKPAPTAAEKRAKQIATAILLAKTGGVGPGKEGSEEWKAGKAEAEEAVARKIRKGTKKDVDAWFANFEPDAKFLGLQIRHSSPGEPPGVHHELAQVLADAERRLVKQGEEPAAAAKRLGVKDIAGLRVPKTPTGKPSGASMHCFGLAVDIDHDDNPFIGNLDKPSKKRPEGGPSIQIIEHATLLLGGGARDPRRAPPSLGEHETASEADREARATRAEKQWELLNVDSRLVQEYLSMTSDEVDKIVARRLAALKTWQQLQTAEPAQDATDKKKKRKKGPTPPPWVEHVSDPAWWRDQHNRDIKQSKSGDFGFGAEPTKFGFMTLREEVVKALVQAGLTWGGTYPGDKDLMHFDLRTGSIGAPVF